MSDLISRSALIEELQKCFVNNSIHKNDLAEAIAKQPTVKAKPVVHGKWKTEFTAFLAVYRCSECNCATALGQTNFCPNCGADMRKKVQDEK